MDRAVNKAAADEQGSWPRKGKEQGHSPASPVGQPDLHRQESWGSSCSLPSHQCSPQQTHEWWGETRALCEKCEVVSPYRCCVKGVQRHVYKYIIYICLFLWIFLAENLLPQLLPKPDEKYDEFMIQCTLVTCQHTAGHKHISMCLCMTCKAKQMHYRHPADLAVPFRSGLNIKTQHT